MDKKGNYNKPQQHALQDIIIFLYRVIIALEAAGYQIDSATQATLATPLRFHLPRQIWKETKAVFVYCGGSKRRYGCNVCTSIEQGNDASAPTAQNKRQEGLENFEGWTGVVFLGYGVERNLLEQTGGNR